MNIASLCQSVSSSLSQLQLNQSSLSIKGAPVKSCRKSQSTSLLSSWFSWTFPKRRNPSVTPMALGGPTKMSANQNISDISSVHAKIDTLHVTPPQKLHIKHQHEQYTSPALSFSLPSSASITTTSSLSKSNRPLKDGSVGYRRSVSFMLSRLGTKVRRVIQNSSQRIQPQLKSSINTTCHDSNGVAKPALEKSFSSDNNAKVKIDDESVNSSSLKQQQQSPPQRIGSQERQLLFDAIDLEIDANLDDSTDDGSSMDMDDSLATQKDKVNVKTPWSPPGTSAKQTIKASKTDTNMKHELSVPFIKMGLGKRKSLDVDDQVQYTTRSISSTSFALQWQEKFHGQQQPQERIISTLKSVSLTLFDIIRYNHAYQQFTSDTTYVAHPDLHPGEDAQELFATVPVAHWQDIFDQIAYIFENGVLTAEHAIITVIYIERMLENSKQHLCEVNWRLIVLAGLLTSIKVWDDCAVYNMDFVQIFPELDIKHV
ncbi:hypothetical protein BC941DRAFT_408300 [Chlamydoabsidia padenii]|nr:hypothetical protein BC941DRAFT_408300 [Chlamydoabsidia padenii]